MKGLLCAIVLLPVLAVAGFDDYRTVVSLRGRCEARGAINGKRTSRWLPLKAGDVISPNSEVRTGSGATIKLQLGDEARDRPQSISYGEMLYANSHVKIRSQYRGHDHIIHLVSGRVKTWKKVNP